MLGCTREINLLAGPAGEGQAPTQKLKLCYHFLDGGTTWACHRQKATAPSTHDGSIEVTEANDTIHI